MAKQVASNQYAVVVRVQFWCKHWRRRLSAGCVAVV